ncbi:MAG: ABC transporter permease subunit [Rhizomicrobium sp.]
MSGNGNSKDVVIRVRGLVNAFNGKVIHDHLDLDVMRGEVLGVVGGSGAGKSVLLRSIIGLNHPVEGSIEVFGTETAGIDASELKGLQLRWGVLFQGGALFSSQTVAENIQVPLRRYTHMNQELMDEIAAMKLSLVGLPPSLWVYSPTLVIPSLVLVEVWHWTPLVMLIVLGGLAAIPAEPYESALIDGANLWQVFRYITLPLITPFLFIAAMIRMIDAVKSFDVIYAITQGGPGTASETINLYLYSVAFAYYDVGYASAIAVVFFALIVALAGALLHLRRRTQSPEIGGGA